jgi:hypothetical protein
MPNPDEPLYIDWYLLICNVGGLRPPTLQINRYLFTRTWYKLLQAGMVGHSDLSILVTISPACCTPFALPIVLHTCYDKLAIMQP